MGLTHNFNSKKKGGGGGGKKRYDLFFALPPITSVCERSLMLKISYKTVHGGGGTTKRKY